MSMVLGAVVGGAAGWFAYTKITGVNNALMSVGAIGAGLGLTLFSKEPLMEGLGLGLAGAGGIMAGETFGLLSGVGKVDNLPNASRKIFGYREVRQIAGAPAVPASRFPSPGVVGARPIVKKFAGIMPR